MFPPAIWFFMFLIFFSCSVNASEPDSESSLTSPDSYAGKVVSSLEIRPRSILSPEDIQKRCQIRTGLLLSGQVIRDCISQFYRTGAFQDVVVEAMPDETGEGVKLIFTFVEKERIGALSVKGAGAFLAKKILTVAGLKPGIEFVRGDLPDMEQRVLLWYRQQGYLEAKLRFEASPLRRSKDIRLTLFIEEGPLAKVSGLIFTGEKVWEDEVLLSHIKTRVGKPYRRDLLEKDLEALVAAFVGKGYLHAVVGPMQEVYIPSEAGVKVTIPVESGPHVEVLVDGNRAFDRDKLMKILNVGQERNLDEIVLEGAARRLRDFYQGQGYYFATVTYLQKTVDPGHFQVRFQIDEEKRLSIGQMFFDGNHFFTDKRIEKILQSRRKGLLLDEAVRKDVETLRALYQEEGFVDPTIRADPEFNPDKTRVNLHFHVEEGQRVFIGRISFEGNQAESSEDILSRLASLEGQPYREGKARDDRYEIQSLYAQKGYIYATVGFQADFSFDGRYAMLTYRIHEDQQVTLGKVYLRGNTITRSNVILRELTLKPGDPFNYERILLDQRKIQRLGIFSEARLEPVRPDFKEAIKDLTLRVEEGKPGSVEFGLGYGDVERFRGSFQVVHNNLFGTGRQASFRIEGSSIEQKYTLGYKEPWFLGLSMNGRVDVVNQIEDKISFRRRTLGTTVGVEKSFGEQIHTSLLYQYEDVALSEVQPGAILTEEDSGKGKVRVATINPSLIMDFRNDPFNPTAGSFYSIAFRDAAQTFGGKPQFVKLTVQGDWFYSPFSRIVLAGSWRGGAAQRFGESQEVPIFERYFVGGRSTVRGYDQERLGVPGETINFQDGKWTPTGGNAMMVLNGEVRISPPWGGLGLVLFVDSGNVWTKMENVNPAELRSTYGGGLRYNTPVGPLRLDMGCKMDRENGESQCVTHFTLGHAF